MIEKTEYRNLPYNVANAVLEKLIQRSEKVVFHNAIFDTSVLKKIGINIPIDKVEDTILAHHAINTERLHGLKSIMIDEYGKEDTVKYKEAEKAGFAVFSQYGEDDAINTMALYLDLQSKLDKLPRVKDLYYKHDLPLMEVMRDMNVERNYIRIDKPLYDAFARNLFDEIDIITTKLADILGEINFDSQKQLGDALSRHGYKIKRKKPTEFMIKQAEKKGMTAEGNYTLDEDALDELQEKQGGLIIELILHRRSLMTLNSTFIQGIEDQIVEVDEGIFVLTGYNFNQIGTRTGRLSSTHPNMQNQPRDPTPMLILITRKLIKLGLLKTKALFITEKEVKDIIAKQSPKRQAQLKAILKPYFIDMRSIFIPMPGKVFIGADESQLELRMMGAYSNDPFLLDAYNNDRDVHQRMADNMTTRIGMPIERWKAKESNFSLLYGMWYKTFARKLRIAEDLAEKLVRAWKEELKVVGAFVERVHSSAIRTGWVCTILGRRRCLLSMGIRDMDRGNWWRHNNAKNAAVSTVIQGSAGDLVKQSMINIWQQICQGDSCRIVLQIHDELLLEADEDKAEGFVPIIKKEMETSLSHIIKNIKFKVEPNIGMSWREVH
jgi:DNA polymerase-1